VPTLVTPVQAGRPPHPTRHGDRYERRNPPQLGGQRRHLPSALPARAAGLLLVLALVVLLLALTGGSAFAADGHRLLSAAPPAAPTLDSVITGLRNWLVGLLAAVATLFLTIGGIRYITAGGDPMHVERAKTALRSAAIGYALAALSPLLVGVLRSVVG
jgi:succinate dehydrogenase hydrophobic anchor subunit